jgi:cyclopropane fatty-acyl-phospholipid synthase-like methyltransferase
MRNLKDFYRKQFKKFGPSLPGVGWGKNKKSEIRYRVIIKLLKQVNTKNEKLTLLDVGCGYGELIEYFPKNYNISYLGVDIVDEMIVYAKKKYKKKENIRFKQINFLKLKKKYDIVVCNGIFTLRNNLTNQKMLNYIYKCLTHFDKLSKIGYCFNIMCEKVDYNSKILFYPKLKNITDKIKSKKLSKIIVDKKSVKYENFILVKK